MFPCWTAADKRLIGDAEKLLHRALAGCDKELKPDDLSMLVTVRYLGDLYAS